MRQSPHGSPSVKYTLLLLVIVFLFTPLFAWGDVSTSTNFNLEPAIIDVGGSGATSTSFSLRSSIGQPATGISTSTSFTLRGGFLNFPTSTFIQSPPPPPPTPPPPSPSPSPSSGGGGGGGGGGSSPQTIVIFRGKAYPSSFVTLLKDAQVAATTKAGPDANFEISLSGLSGGTYVFGVWAEDSKGIRSIAHTFTISVTGGTTAIVSGIFIAPTISVDKTEVKRGDVLNILGQSAPNAAVTITVNSGEELVKKTNADAGGGWLYSFDTLEVDYGDHSTRARAARDGEITTFSALVNFKVGTKNVIAQAPAKCPPKGDLNGDCKVNLVDFSVLAYWYKRPLTAAMRTKVDLNLDGKVDITDFSIMVYYWTG